MIVLDVFADDVAEKFLFDDEPLPPKINRRLKDFCNALYWQAACDRGELDDYLESPAGKNIAVPAANLKKGSHTR